MRRHHLFKTLPLALVIVFGGVQWATPLSGRQTAAAVADRIVLTPAERVGFSSESLKELDAAMQGIVDKKHLAGIVTLLARHGQVVQHKAYGVQDIDSQAPMQLDTIMRIYSLGFGYDFAVMDDPVALKSPLGKGSYWWWGIAGTWFWIDPANDVVFIGMIQRRGGAPGAANHEELSRSITYKALVDPGK